MDLETKDNRGGSTEVSAPQSAPILIIDDDPEFRPALARLLSKRGFRTLEAKGALEGLAVVRESNPGAILLDLCLVGKDPTDTAAAEFVLKILKGSALTRDIPVLAISGIHRDAETEARLKRLGADAFFTKLEATMNGPLFRNLQARLLLRDAVPASPFAAEPCLEPPKEEERGFPLPLSILVIDDQEDTAKLLRWLLKEHPGPSEVHWVENGKKGLSQAKTLLPDLVILDLHLPDLDGKEICRRLRESDRSFYLPILMLTGDARMERQIECLKLGADDFVLKTAPGDLLLARALGLVSRRRFGVKDNGALKIGGVELDPRLHELTIAGRKKPIGLTKKETGLVLLLMSSEGRSISSQELHQKTSNDRLKPHSSTMRSHISHIRSKLGAHERLIQCVEKEDAYYFDAEYARSLSRPTDGTTS